jgi:predicted transcriptional regulator
MGMIREIEPAMREICDIEYLPYSTMHQLAHIYSQNAYHFDGLLFSGAFPYEYIAKYVGAVARPHAYFELTDRDYYKLFARLLYKNPNMDISRIAMDVPTVFLDFEHVFDSSRPVFFDAVLGSDIVMEQAYDAVIKQAVQLWCDKKIDMVISRLTNVIGKFAEAGIPCERLFPSPASMLETFHSLISKIQSRILDDSMIAIGLVLAVDEGEEARSALKAALASFNKNMGMALVVRESGACFELITSNDCLRELTKEYTHCLLSGYLAATLGGAVCIGWGLGRNAIQTRQNAMRALQQSRRNTQHSAYLMNAFEEEIGPLEHGKAVTVAGEPDAVIERVSRKLGISSANLQKLINLQEKRDTNRFSSAELAYYLNITPRSASRILAKLAEYGGAEVVQSVQASPKGRPFMIYEVDYRKLDKALALPSMPI